MSDAGRISRSVPVEPGAGYTVVPVTSGVVVVVVTGAEVVATGPVVVGPDDVVGAAVVGVALVVVAAVVVTELGAVGAESAASGRVQPASARAATSTTVARRAVRPPRRGGVVMAGFWQPGRWAGRRVPATRRARGRMSRMSRTIRVAGGQLGPIQRDHTRAEVVQRLIALLHQAADAGCDLIVYPELALTTFFPRWYVPDISEFDYWYETEMPNEATRPLFDEAKRLGVGFCLGYAQIEHRDDGTTHRWNRMMLVDQLGEPVAVFTKVHIPGHEEHDPTRPFQHAERFYFEQSPDGFGVWDAFGGRVGMMICNDRRWPESYREMGLQGVELILCGYNTPIHYAPDPTQDPLQGFHNRLVMQAGAYQNGTFVVGVAKGGVEEGVPSLAESCIIAPSGELLAQAETDEDELIWADLDLDWCKQYTGTLFDMDYYRRPEAYTRLTTMRGPGG